MRFRARFCRALFWRVAGGRKRRCHALDGHARRRRECRVERHVPDAGAALPVGHRGCQRRPRPRRPEGGEPRGVLSGAKRASQAELEDREESDESGRGVSAKRPKPPPSKTQPLDERSSAALWCARHATIASAAAAVRPAPGAVMTKRPTNASPPGCATSGASSAAAKKFFILRAARRASAVSVGFRRVRSAVYRKVVMPPLDVDTVDTVPRVLHSHPSRFFPLQPPHDLRRATAAPDASVQPCTTTPRTPAPRARVLSSGSSLPSPHSTTRARVRSTTSRRFCTRLASMTCGCLFDRKGGSARVSPPASPSGKRLRVSGRFGPGRGNEPSVVCRQIRIGRRCCSKKNRPAVLARLRAERDADRPRERRDRRRSRTFAS